MGGGSIHERVIDGEAEDKYQSRNGNRKFSLSRRREGRMGRWDGGEEHRWNTLMIAQL